MHAVHIGHSTTSCVALDTYLGALPGTCHFCAPCVVLQVLNQGGSCDIVCVCVSVCAYVACRVVCLRLTSCSDS